ncbi:MAG: FkbM family methyltransferase [Syntrophaceae bacterium]|nr:FkbM family methyltransferase [Syntrophaceae bacterium]
MPKRLKSFLYRRWPELAAASEAYSAVRSIRKAGVRETPWGFRFIGPVEMQEGRFEKEEAQVIRDCISRADVFIDVGANVGYYTCLARSLGRIVIAVEPLSQNLQFLYSNLEANGWRDVEVHPLGLSAAPGLAVLHGTGTAASLVEGWAGPSTKHRPIPLTTLDALLAGRFRARKLFIKVDVEGVEFDLLQGAGETLRRDLPPVWIVETGIGGWCPESHDSRFREIFELFWSLGYRSRTVGRETVPVTEKEVAAWLKEQSTDGFSNFLFEKAG